MADAAIEVELFEDPRTFLDVAGEHLAAHPVESTVVTAFTRRAADGEPHRGDGPRWWAVVREHGRVVGAAMRTAPGAPHPAFVLAMPDAGAAALARAVHARGERLLAANGALPAVQVVAATTARLTGRRVEVVERTRLHVLDGPGALVEPRTVPGRLRPAALEDLDVATRWFDDFGRAADEQAGRAPSVGVDAFTEAEVARRIEHGRVWLWEDAAGAVVHLTGANLPTYGVARIGPVYTPREQRGRGYASAAVAGVSRHLLGLGARVCLFTDQANPTSNRIYAALGYRPVVDMADLVLR